MKPTRKSPLLALAVALLGVLSCRNQNTVIVPNRVLDRPLDVTLACVRPLEEGIQVLALNQCDAASRASCSDEESPQLIGFVANSEKNEVGMFRRCDTNGMVDLDPEAPGYNLVPVGALPSRIVQTPDCRVVTANWNSCDLSAIEMPPLAAYAVGTQPESAPSGLVTTIVPRRSDGTPLGASPGDMIAMPRGLSLAGNEDGPIGGAEDGSADDSDTATGGADDATGGGDDVVGVCDPDASASVLVTFPACQLVAEISLDTQRVLQSRQFVVGDDGAVTLVDTGPDPVCPIECPEQFDGDLPDDRPDAQSVSDAEVFPVALALIEPDESSDAAPEESEVLFASVFVGGSGSDEIFEIELLRDDASNAGLGFAPPDDLRRLELERPAGVVAIRPTPPMTIDGGIHQFLYVIAGDGSTHVVDRNFDGTSLGVECDTQVDPSQASSRACHPIDPGSQGGQAERRPFAQGPGIRDNIGGSTITDWTFERAFDPKDDKNRSRSPFARAGVVGIGVTSFGRVVLGVFGQYDDALPTVTAAGADDSVDPIGLLNVEIRPHMLWPVTDPQSGEPSVLPLVTDEEPNRVLPGEDQLTQVLAPSLRRIDLAYFADGSSDYSAEQKARWQSLGMPANRDDLGSFDGDALYDNFPARVAVRDYRQWRPAVKWQLIWEPAIPGTESTTGRVVCDDPSDYGGGTCQVGAIPGTDPVEHTQVRVVDEGATFCDEGVLPGDKLVLFGCGADQDCGAGRRCLRDPTAPGGQSGICVSAEAYDTELDRLRSVCAPFIADPCGAPRREYVITQAKQTELTLGAMDIPATTFMRRDCPTPAGRDNLVDPLGAKPGDEVNACLDTSRVPKLEGVPCSGGFPVECDAHCYPEDSDCSDAELGLRECEARLTCALPDGKQQPSGGCTSDDECAGLGTSDEPGVGGAQYLCIDNVCRTPCEGGSFNCRQALLPGPGCFAEFVRYAVATRNTFTVGLEGPATFIPDQVITDPDTQECRRDPTVSNLLTSRIQLGADEASTFANIPDCPNADEASPSDPNPCRIVELRSQDDSTLYHAFEYEGTPVEALRFSNPYGTLVIDMVSLLDLSGTTGLLQSERFPDCYARFRRARIPRNYREEFTTPNPTGYQAYNDTIVVGNTPLTYPVRVVPAPETGVAFAVDAGGRGGVTGVRGQVVRLTIGDGAIRGDEQFRVR